MIFRQSKMFYSINCHQLIKHVYKKRVGVVSELKNLMLKYFV